MKNSHHIQSQSEWENEISIKILNCIRNDIYLDLRFLDIALSSLVWQPAEDSSNSSSVFATDGNSLYFVTGSLINLFKTNPKYLNRVYLHSIMHCIFSHLWIRGGRNRDLWNISCDIAVEYTIDQIDKPCTKRPLSLVRLKCYDYLTTLENGCSAAGIYKYLHTLNSDLINQLRLEFHTDDHRHWPDEEKKSPSTKSPDNAQEKWNKISRQTALKQRQQNDTDEKAANLLESQIQANRHKRSYREFLNKFTTLHEEIKCDPDEFDLNYYSYGLQIYKNMPLIEPLESTESKKITELVIVIDTSYSTNGTMVNDFLNETFTILTEHNSFFDKFKVRIIQCDDTVHSDTLVTSKDSIKYLQNQLKITGGGNTDFRPAFTYISNLIENHIINDMCGLIYFTDGKGIYPKSPPPYKTAFLFSDDSNQDNVPPWATKGQYNEY